MVGGGVDGSAPLVAPARAKYPGIEFLTHDLVGGLPLPRRRYGRIVSHLVLMDIPELDKVLADIAASLGDNGLFGISILHPSFFGQPPIQDPLTGRWARRVSGQPRP